MIPATGTPRERVAIVCPGAYLDTVSVLCDTAELLAERGFAVDIFTDGGPDFLRPVFSNVNVSLIDLGSTVVAARANDGAEAPRWNPLGRLGRRLRRAANWATRTAILSFRMFLGALRVRRLNQEMRYRCFIGVDQEGLWLAASLSRFVHAPLVYYSLELFSSDEVTTPGQRYAKRREIALSRKAAFVVIQDAERARLMVDDNGVPSERFVFVPNAPIGPARRAKSGYWHDRFCLSADRRILLYSGSLGGWTGVEDIVSSAAVLPENWVLVVHTRQSAESTGEIQRLRELADPGKVLLSLQPVARQEYGRLVDGADIGIAFYVLEPGSPFTQRNIQVIGLSSGKVAHYLRAGLPVVVNSFASIGEVVEREGLGVRVRDASQIGEAVSKIAAEYEQYSRQAQAFFDQRLDFRHGFERLASRIDTLPDA